MARILVTDLFSKFESRWKSELTSHGHSVVAANDMDLAESILRMFKPDLLILRLDRPGANGANALKRLQSSSPGTPVLMVPLHLEVAGRPSVSAGKMKKRRRNKADWM